ncbi:uncharacterized protein [Drosophila virilis]|uniref:uncharacterized protein n=1 Tax=Drosophila virilis TaxID=7244 RepID=UPI001395DB6B|nr:uncharacterized protein LOC116651462 [Drosophila virilis]
MELAAIACALLLAMGPWVSGEVNDTIRDKIVLHTPLQNYEQPSLRDYEDCQANRQSCMDTCAGRDKCESECPLCPELTDEPLLVQGVNDTSYVAPAQPALNTTNIIRLTNEINNIIKTKIQGRNEVNVKVHQNVSQVGGRFGLGYNEQGSCCYVVRRERICEHKEHCREHSRHRVCGERCQARVMHAKRVVICEKYQPDVCQETVEYVPVHRRRSKPRKQARTRSPTRSQSQSQAPRCYNLSAWPYVACGQDPNSIRLKRSSCQNCLQLNYGYILQNGLPAGCTGCFVNYGAPLIPTPLFYAPYPYLNFNNYQPPPMYEDQGQLQEAEQEEEQEKDTAQDKELDNDTDTDSGWVLESEKCVGDDGQLEDCKSGDNGNDVPKRKPSPPAHLEEDSKDYDYDPGYDVPAQRRRRRQSNGKFIRSLYSRHTSK